MSSDWVRFVDPVNISNKFISWILNINFLKFPFGFRSYLIENPTKILLICIIQVFLFLFIFLEQLVLVITSFFAAKIWYKSIILLLYYPTLFFYNNIIKFFIKRCISHVFQFLSEILYVDLSFTFRLFKLILNWQQISLWFLVSLRFVLLWRWRWNIKLGIFYDWRFN